MQKSKPHSYSTNPKWLIILATSLIILSLSCNLFGNGDSQNADSLKQTEVALGVQQTMIAAERELTSEPQVDATSSSEPTLSPEFSPTTEVLASDTPPAILLTEVDETEEGTVAINRQAYAHQRCSRRQQLRIRPDVQLCWRQSHRSGARGLRRRLFSLPVKPRDDACWLA